MHRILLTICYIPLTTALGADSAIESLHNYFNETPVCTVAKVNEITHIERNITIDLDIEPATRKALSAMHNESRNNWMSLHCPNPQHEVWNAVDDIFVQSTTTDVLRMSCANYFESKFNLRKNTKNSVAQRIKKLLENLPD